ncbi:hypothetical protein K6V98_07775 [Collinsella sp. AGMB00827]|uniref:Uncharacterized protein n=1 Tax=Collinsella ureilytica TaxID=2869515 RepID=A0ABS7MLJ3_9ACTN|nr:hypothetical protein [Collinsella urealyticum]MBY4798243.1 hypothetical protein [Collinsella urealyticum]
MSAWSDALELVLNRKGRAMFAEIVTGITGFAGLMAANLVGIFFYNK